MLALWCRITKMLLLIMIISGIVYPALAQTRTHTVVRGENLFRIGLRYGCTVTEMARANNIADPTRIFPGQVLIIPDCSGIPTITTATPNTTTSTTPSSGATPASSTMNFIGTPEDNWCFAGGPWGDGRCDQGDAGQRNYMWLMGWIMPRVQRGEIAQAALPVEFGGTAGIVTTPTNNNSGGSSGNTTTTPTGTTTGGSSGAPVGCVNGTVVELVNCARAQSGLAPLFANAFLEVAALGHAQDMVNNSFFSHTGSNGFDVGQRVTAVGYIWTTVGENIAQGQTTDFQVFNDWMASPGHQANILNPAFVDIGVARVGNTWVQVFGHP